MVESGSSRIGPINLDAKQTGERSAGNPHTAFDVAGAGNVVRSRKFDQTGAPVPDPTWESPRVKVPRATRQEGAPSYRELDGRSSIGSCRLLRDMALSAGAS